MHYKWKEIVDVVCKTPTENHREPTTDENITPIALKG
jgi:hypothetical protein